MTDPRLVAIASQDDPRLAPFRDVKGGDARLRREHGLFMVEGRLNVEALVEHGRFETAAVLVKPSVCDAMAETWGALAPGVPVYVAAPEVLSGIVGFDFHRGCMAVARVGDEVASLVPARAPSLIVALEDLTDVDNVGSVFRNALALGASGVLLSPRCCDPLCRKAIRVSMGAVLRVPYARAKMWPGDLLAWRAAGHMLVALDLAADAEPLGDFAARSADRGVVLLAGTEGAGLADETRRIADARVRIPMVPDVDSLNVATAVAIALQRLGEGGLANEGPGEVAR